MQTQKQERCLGYASFSENEPLKPWEFDLRPLGADDVEVQARPILFILRILFFQNAHVWLLFSLFG